MTDPRLVELGQRLARIRVGLRDEADAQPGQQRIYGRLHESGRSTSARRYSMTGEQLPGAVRYAADCTAPDHGRCTHNDGGSWRPVPGVARADALVGSSHYEVDPRDALVYCRFPFRRALVRLRRESTNRYDVLQRLLEGYSVLAAWTGLGSPPDPLASAVGIARQVEEMAREEAWSTREPKPRTGWVDKSDSQRAAEEASGAVA